MLGNIHSNWHDQNKDFCLKTHCSHYKRIHVYYEVFAKHTNKNKEVHIYVFTKLGSQRKCSFASSLERPWNFSVLLNLLHRHELKDENNIAKDGCIFLEVRLLDVKSYVQLCENLGKPWNNN